MADVTNLSVEYVWLELPLAVGRQYEQVFYSKHRVKSTTIEGARQRISRGMKEVV